MRRYYVWNIGCQMNRADAYRVRERLEHLGYRPAGTLTQADVVVLNTCVVRQSAEDKVTGRLTSLSTLKERDERPRLLVVMGCYVGDPVALRDRYPYVDVFLRPSDINGVLDAVCEWERAIGCGDGRPAGRSGTSAEICELVPVSYGCDHHCTYCIVRLRRGPQRSRPIGDIVADVESLVSRGAREVTLLGQNVDAYGQDLADSVDLADVLRAVHDVDGVWRVRFLTSHPGEMTPRIIETAAMLPKVCEAWELPVQSGDDEVLRRMARGYTVERFRDLVRAIREATPACSIATDVIVGFPGETEEQFERTLDLIREVRFDTVHVAAYSVRPGTPAARWDDDVPAEEKERRRALVEETQEAIAAEINAAHLGRIVEVLVDGRQRGRWRGRTRTNKLVFFDSDDDWLGCMALVRVTWAGPWSMRGEVVAR